MRSVEHDGSRYLLIKESGETSLVRDPDTGDEQYLPNDELRVTGESPLAVAASTIPEGTRVLLTAVHSTDALGLLLEVDTRGPLTTREIIEAYDRCEADLHGLLGELRAAGLLTTVNPGDERNPQYDTTTLASDALESLH